MRNGWGQKKWMWNERGYEKAKQKKKMRRRNNCGPTKQTVHPPFFISFSSECLFHQHRAHVHTQTRTSRGHPCPFSSGTPWKPIAPSLSLQPHAPHSTWPSSWWPGAFSNGIMQTDRKWTNDKKKSERARDKKTLIWFEQWLHRFPILAQRCTGHWLTGPCWEREPPVPAKRPLFDI